MTREEAIKKLESLKISLPAAKDEISGIIKLIESPWISVKDDLPCNHKELIEGLNTKRVIIYTGTTVCSNRMNYINGKWQWFGGKKVTHWLPIPELPK